MINELVTVLMSTILHITPLTDESSVNGLLSHKTVVAHNTLNLDKRALGKGVNDVFSNNIVLALHYMAEDNQLSVEDSTDSADFKFYFKLEPGQIMAFHDNILPEFEGKNVVYFKSHFDKSDGYEAFNNLYGNGVCHLASFINWTANNADLKVTSKVSHDFAIVPGVPKEYGTSIYYLPNSYDSKMQNLYIENTYGVPVYFYFDLNGDTLDLSVLK